MVYRSVTPPPPRMADRATSRKVTKHEIKRSTPTLDSTQIVAELRAKIRTGQLSSDVTQQIVDAARMVTRADGAALAMRQNHSFLCMARAGHMAPDLGTELNADSGISGECLRTGTALRCDDTSVDTRVDAEACRRLGLRSLAVAPVGNTPAVNGILEAFSADPHAFHDTQVQLLGDLAELVMAAQPRPTESAVVGIRQELARPAWLRIRQALASTVLKSPRRKLIVAVGAAAVLAFAGWLGFRGKPGRSDFSGAPRSGQAASAVIPGPSTFQVDQEGSTAVSVPARKASPSRGVVMASTTEKSRQSESLVARKSQPEAVSGSDAGSNGADANPPSPAPQGEADTGVTAPPLAVVSGGTETVLAEVLSPPNDLPVPPAPKVSQGISGGTLERHVNPIYPPDARRRNIEGRVVLQASVTEQGAVRDLKVIAGDGLLARAAMDAVAQWHYRPFRLNGQPIRMTTEITLIFKLQ